MGSATSLIGGGIGALGSLTSALEGNRRRRESEQALSNYPRQDLFNPNANLQVSTAGSDLQREELQRNNATTLSALQSSGTRGIVSGLPYVLQNNTDTARNIGATLDQQIAQNNLYEAQGLSQQMQMQEAREQADLAGIGRERDAGIQQMWNGYGGALNSALSGAVNYSILRPMERQYRINGLATGNGNNQTLNGANGTATNATNATVNNAGPTYYPYNYNYGNIISQFPLNLPASLQFLRR